MSSPKVAEPTMEDRLAQVRLRLKKARGDNLQAAEEEGRCPRRVPGHEDKDARPRKTMTAKRKRRREAAVEGESDEEVDPIVRSLNARAAKISRGDDDAPDTGTVPSVYGGTSGAVGAVQAERLVNDLRETEKRRARFNRRRAFVEDRADISFINEGNRTYNRILEKHYDGYESVRNIKESLERGTALPSP